MGEPEKLESDKVYRCPVCESTLRFAAGTPKWAFRDASNSAHCPQCASSNRTSYDDDYANKES